MPRTKHSQKWMRVTPEFVATFAEKAHAHCDGKGYVGEESSGYTVCSCAALAFRREMIGTGRVRRRSQRIGTRDVAWLEYNPMAAVPESNLDDNQR